MLSALSSLRRPQHRRSPALCRLHSLSRRAGGYRSSFPLRMRAMNKSNTDRHWNERALTRERRRPRQHRLDTVQRDLELGLHLHPAVGRDAGRWRSDCGNGYVTQPATRARAATSTVSIIAEKHYRARWRQLPRRDRTTDSSTPVSSTRRLRCGRLRRGRLRAGADQPAGRGPSRQPRSATWPAG